MIKNDRWITEFGLAHGIEPFSEGQVNPASYDVTLGNSWVYLQGSENVEVKCNEFILHPGQVVLATTEEYVSVPRDVCCDLKLKSTIGRSWINHSLSGWVDAGFKGQITLELQNIGVVPYTLYRGMRVAQLVFMGMEEPPIIAYGEGKGRYQYQLGATKAR